MPSTTFNPGTVIPSVWLNEVNTGIFTTLPGKADLSALAASGGSALVGFQQSGTGTVARTSQDKLRDWVNVKDFGAKGDGTTDDTVAIQAALNASACVVFQPLTYKITSNITIPSGVTVIWNGATIKAHFSGWMFTLLFPGKQTFIGTLNLTDSDPSVVSSATTITNGIQFGAPGQAIHDFNGVASQINASQLRQAYYISYQSYSNAYGVLSMYCCGDTAVNALKMDVSGSLYANDSSFVKVQCTGVVSSTWNGAGPLFQGYGITVNQLHCESIYNTVGASLAAGSVNVVGGYFECVGGTATSNTISVASGCNAAFTGVLINSPMSFAQQTTLTGCRLLVTTLHAYARYVNCSWPNSNQLTLDLTGLSYEQLPRFGTGSANIAFKSNSGNWSEWGSGAGYTGVPLDFDYFGGNHTKAIDSAAFSGQTSLKLTNASAQYFGAVGFWVSPAQNGQLFAWAIVKTSSSSANLLVGVGGVTGSGSFNSNAITTVPSTLNTKWVLVVQPNVTPFTSATYSSNYGIYFEDTSNQALSFNIDSFGLESGGISYHNIFLKLNGSPYTSGFRKATTAPTTGTWSVGDRVVNSSPAVGQPKAWVCTVAGAPGTWTSEGNL